jgi:beta-carotene 3-hydroxylase
LNAVLEPEQSNSSSSSSSEGGGSEASNNNNTAAAAPKVKRLTKSEREKNSKDYEWAALISSCGVTSIAITATYFRLLRSYNLMDDGGASVFPTAELFAQLALIAGAAVGMEFYARFAHKYLWHDVWWSMPMKYRKDWNRKIWLLHESHHLPREGAFEANDIFAVANGVPAFVLCAYGFFTPGVYGGLCFGAGLGITLFGIAYMYVHDGMVHKRFPTGPLGKLPWLRRVAAAHTIHHTEQFKGAPWGLFLGEDELRKHPGGIEELDKVCLANDRADKRREMECLAAGFSKAEECDVPMELSVGSSKDEYLVVSQDETELGIKAGLHIPSQVEPPQCVITEDGKRINESANAEARE